MSRMYTMESFLSAIGWLSLLLGLIILNFYGYYRQKSLPARWWFHSASFLIAGVCCLKIMIIAMLEMPIKTSFQQFTYLLSWAASITLLFAAFFYWQTTRQKSNSNPEPSLPLPLASLFQAMEDWICIYDSDFNLMSSNHQDYPLYSVTELHHLPSFLHQVNLLLSKEESTRLHLFLNHLDAKNALMDIQLLLHPFKSYMVLSKVLDHHRIWVGTIMLIHPAEKELSLIHSIDTQNKQIEAYNQQRQSSLLKLEQFEFEKEKDRLLQDLNLSIIRSIQHHIHQIQRLQENKSLAVNEKRSAIARISEEIGCLYKQLRQTVRQMATKGE
ncbi:OmpH family outer membrane protein [Tindallia californiensis]|uniref:Uncharacterized protein n=1 Tax=Tindallia californiensis TaxID=159292 RepID=A0A1H3P8Q4_9FIRM|nr:OmpH family outer membrane protein [Tindallia californiensis]SDY97496.1 hypothetical protein SAMN05192546_10671 [Tindallia californiensis]